MRKKSILGLVVVCCLWLSATVDNVQGTSADLFEAAGLERFPRVFPIPEVGLPDLEGKQIALRSFHGQVLLMNFWTTW